MVNWNNPTTSSTYSTVLTDINDKASNLAKQDFGADTNLPTGAIRFNSTTKATERWSGSAWAERAGEERALQALITTSGTQPTYVATPTVPWAAYVAGDTIALNIHSTNIGSATLNVSGLGAKTIRYLGRTLVGGELFGGVRAFLYYDGTDFILINHGGGWANWTPTYSTENGSHWTSVTTNRAQYRVDGSAVTFVVSAIGTTITTSPVSLIFSLPITASGGNLSGGADIATAGVGAGGKWGLATLSTIAVSRYDNAALGLGTQRQIGLQGTYFI